MITTLATYVRNYIDISDEEMQLFYKYLRVKKLKKKEYLLTEGRTCQARYFIIKGCLRSFYIDEKGVERILDFGIDKWWFTNYNSLITQNPSENFIQAIENSELLELHNDCFEELLLKLPKIERFFRVIMEKTHIAYLNRIKYTRSFTGEKLYKDFIHSNPVFAQRVPQYMIASYLDLSPEFVSKVRAKDAIK
ncbi:Crp/Fnr family transcriptional regulator [Aquimarina sediminis]|uniref:Crp/Fnr family transcriptional regulator n=1 Tax=Aquimarina sediminis TaxID=2070536 RepID=UPI0013E8D59E|nr:Crp/Fnr family transcriptional regulator [Aquimarina sediminis]